MKHDAAGKAYVLFQRALLGLLAGNCVYYAVAGPAREALDSIAWFTLLVLFYAETSVQARTSRALVAAGLRTARLAAAGAVVVAAFAYVDAAAWLDAGNSALWIAVVVLLEAQVRYPQAASRHRTGFGAVAMLLYGALAALPLAWLAEGAWLDAYDAALWLAAFVTIELDVRPAALTPRRMPRGTPR